MAKNKGGALIIVLLVLTLFSLLAVYMTLNTSASLKSSDNSLQNLTAEFAMRSAEAHARSLLFNDIFANSYDSFLDEWYVQSSPTNKFSKWFFLPVASEKHICKYRFSIKDISPSPENPNDYQTLAPYVRAGEKVIPTDDINALSKNELKKIILRFEKSCTNELKLARAAAELSDDRDANNYLSDENFSETEAIIFNIIADESDTRYIHFDDTLRLGRYYEQRSAHNFFLINDAELFLNNQTGKTNIAVKLDSEPMAKLPGWRDYSKLRTEAGLPMWHAGMWNNIIALTGAGKNLKSQPVITNTTDTLIFADDDFLRFMPTGIFRQTVTFVGWFSSLNELQTRRTRAAKERGAIFTLTNGAPDCIFITNVNPRSDYRMTLYTGSPLQRSMRAAASFFGLDSLQEVIFSKNGCAVFNEGKPATSRAYKKGNYLELIIRSPQAGVSRKNPFFIDSAILEQPEFISFYNSSDKPINVRGWRFGYRCGDLIFYSSPFKTSFYFSVKEAARIENPSPFIPPNSSLILTKDLKLFDRFFGANKNGVWGDNASEKSPLVELANWSPEFEVKSIKSLKTYYQKSASNKKHPWETDWEMEIDGVDWSDKFSDLKNEVVLFDADGEGDDFSPTPGVVVNQQKKSIVVRLAGSKKRFGFSQKARIKFAGLPDVISEYFLLNAEGKKVAAVKKNRKIKRAGFSSMLSRISEDEFEARAIERQSLIREIEKVGFTRKKVRNNIYDSPIEKSEILKSINLSVSNDWHLCGSHFLKFSDAQIQPIGDFKISKDKFKIKSISGKGIIFEEALGFPFGAPGILSDKIFIKSLPPFSIKSFSKRACEIYFPNNFSLTGDFARAAVISPDGTAGGIHLHGAPGEIIFEWTNLPKVNTSAKLTLSGRGSGGAFFPKNIFEKDAETNILLNLSVSIYDSDSGKYFPLVKKGKIDNSDRLFLGKVPARFFKSNRLKIKIRTHKTLTAGRGALRLRGVYLHPFTRKKYVNINTVPKRNMIFVCGGRTNLALAFFKRLRSKKYFKTSGEIFDFIKKEKLDLSGTEKYIPRSEIFLLEIEAQISDNKNNTIIRKTRAQTINREIYEKIILPD